MLIRYEKSMSFIIMIIIMQAIWSLMSVFMCRIYYCKLPSMPMPGLAYHKFFCIILVLGPSTASYRAARGLVSSDHLSPLDLQVTCKAERGSSALTPPLTPSAPVPPTCARRVPLFSVWTHVSTVTESSCSCRCTCLL